MLLSPELPFHPGELQMHKLMSAPTREVPTSPFLTPGAAFMLQRAPLLAIGTLDNEGRPWTTLWGSEIPFAQVLAENVVGVKADIDARYDPVVEILMEGKDGDGVVKLDDGSGAMQSRDEQHIRKIGGLTIDLETRRRVKLAGQMMMGVLAGNVSGKADLTLVTKIDESLGNCPKYLNKKHIVSHPAKPELVSNSPQLSPEAIALLGYADTFFVTSSHEKSTMDTNHRGGPRGFTRVVSNGPSGAVLAWPEYSGNRLYQTLGNFITTPLAGLVFPDFDTGDVLYATGVTEVLTGADAAALLPRSNLAVKLTLTAARFVKSGLAFRGQDGDASPYNPSVRYATTEKVTHGTGSTGKPKNFATLISKTELTPTISRFRFRIEDSGKLKEGWKPGQYATLSFADELDIGYSHMRDDDPRSLNDDFVRTFTVSNPPSKKSMEKDGKSDDEFELTIRKVGSATTSLFRQNPRAGFELPLLGFEGEFKFEDRKDGGLVPIVAAGVGITPVLGQLEYVDVQKLRLLWSTNIVDIGLMADTLKRTPELSKVTTMYITGAEEKDTDGQKELLEQVRQTGVKIERRRLEKADVDKLDAEVEAEDWYMCVGPALKRSLLAWLAGKRIIYEDFDY